MTIGELINAHASKKYISRECTTHHHCDCTSNALRSLSIVLMVAREALEDMANEWGVQDGREFAKYLLQRLEEIS